MVIIVNRLEWVCDRCESCTSQQTVSVIYADGTDGYLCRQHLGDVIREQCGEREEMECPV